MPHPSTLQNPSWRRDLQHKFGPFIPRCNTQYTDADADKDTDTDTDKHIIRPAAKDTDTDKHIIRPAAQVWPFHPPLQHSMTAAPTPLFSTLLLLLLLPD